MNHRELGRVGPVTEVGLGTCNVGGEWGDISDEAGRDAVRAALDAGVDAVEALKPHVPDRTSIAQFSLRWILDHDAVSTVIPGSTSPDHIESNVAAADLDPLAHRLHGVAHDVYDEYVADHVHHRW